MTNGKNLALKAGSALGTALTIGGIGLGAATTTAFWPAFAISALLGGSMLFAKYPLDRKLDLQRLKKRLPVNDGTKTSQFEKVAMRSMIESSRTKLYLKWTASTAAAFYLNLGYSIDSHNDQAFEAFERNAFGQKICKTEYIDSAIHLGRIRTDDGEVFETKSRGLSPREQYLVKEFFSQTLLGRDMDVTLMRMHFNKIACVSIAAAVPGGDFYNSIYLRRRDSDDFTKDNVVRFGTFMHEMTHNWQHQGFGTQTDYSKGPVRTFPLHRDFEQYGSEQQAHIVEDYARYYLHTAKDTTHRWDRPFYTSQLKRIVEDHFPGAKRLREYFEQHGELPSPPVANTNRPDAAPKTELTM